MSRTQDRQSIIQIIKQAAIQYESHMVGRSFLYVFEGKTITVLFRKKDFMHLTGVSSVLSASQFFKNATKGILRETQINFTPRHPYDLCLKKMKYIQNLTDITNTDIFMLEDMTTNTYTYKFCLSELNFTVCLSNDTDKNGNVVSDHYIARSLRTEDSFDRAKNAYEVQYIFSKMNNEQMYNKLMYKDSNVSISDLPQSVLDVLDKSILDE
ncbi:MAG: PBECR4 domain-containing protein [Clostridiales bacterium]|nr:PBECR4 domain-containing protein [Clostridiales bacterium]